MNKIEKQKAMTCTFKIFSRYVNFSRFTMVENETFPPFLPVLNVNKNAFQ